MEVYALSGASGTGKSTSALSFAYKKRIPAIIDDGLLILNGQKIAGSSAKFEKNYISAVKRATFFDEQHKNEVQQAIRNHFIGKILVIGTSDKMVNLIAARLELDKINHYYYVEDIRSSSEIKIAQYIRNTEGKHVIPIPYKQVDQNFFKKLIDKGMEVFSTKEERIGETTIVYPDFHHGTIKIHKKVFKQLVKYICVNFAELVNYESVSIDLQGLPTLNLSVSICFPIQKNIFEELTALQMKIYQHFLDHVNIELFAINISVNKIEKGSSLRR
ncbi:hypothetical protein [Cytobacillus praedii]|uniref:hypothetical protein n=1 Tax=Cytobacillus praedii TaxID=1742358 RepID=UPI002E251656|nr:hypothetical protein [Cytobacillus praedii]